MFLTDTEFYELVRKFAQFAKFAASLPPMTDIAIRVDNLSKLYHLGAVHQRPDTLRDALTGFLPRISRITRIGDRKNPSNPSNPWQASASPDDLWALKDVSFEAQRGEVVG